MNLFTRDIATFFFALSDEVRIKIVALLYSSPLTVKEIQAKIGFLTLPAISHQLRMLENKKIIAYEKKGREKFYSLTDQHVVHILTDAYHHMRGDCDEKFQCGETDTHILEMVIQ